MQNGYPEQAPVSTPIQEFMDYLARERGLNERSCKTYQDVLRTVDAAVKGRLDQVTVEELRRSYVYHPDTVTKSPGTLKLQRAVLRHFYRFQEERAGDRATKRRCTELVRFLGSLKFPRSQRLPQTLTQDEVDRVRRALEEQEAVAGPRARFRVLRDRLSFELLVTVGLRKSELLGLRTSDLVEHADPQRPGQRQQWLRIMGKGRRERVVPLGPRAAELLTRYLASRPSSSDRLFELCASSVNVIVARCLAVAGISRRLGPHSLRHTCASLLVQRGISPVIVQALLGHASLSTTSIYTHVSPENVRQAVVEACPI